MKIALNVNGKPATIDASDPQMPLLYALHAPFWSTAQQYAHA